MDEATSGPRAQRGLFSRCLARLAAEPAPLPAFEGKSWTPALLLGLVCTGAFIGQLDATIVQLALPELARLFDARVEQVSWVALGYLVATAAFLPISGRLCEMLGRKSLYVAGYAVFVAASALCGFATTLGELVAFRILQGMGGSLLAANSIAILVATIPAEKRGHALGVFAAAQAVGMSAGPAIGGLVLAVLDWRWVFWLSVPFGLAATAIGWVALPRTRDIAAGARFDVGGALLVGPAIVCLVVALNHAAAWGATSPATLGMLALAILLLVLLVRRERAAAQPLVDIRLFARAAFSCGALAVLLAFALLFGMFFLMSFALVHGHGDSPAAAGLRLAIIPVAIGLTAPFSGALSARLGPARLGAAGMACCLLALWLLGMGEQEIGHGRPIETVAFLLFGIGLGAFIAPNNHVTLAAAPPQQAGSAGSLLNLMRLLGTSLGVAASASMLAWRLAAEGSPEGWRTASPAVMLAAVEDGVLLLAGLAVLAAGAAVLAARRLTAAPA